MSFADALPQESLVYGQQVKQYEKEKQNKTWGSDACVLQTTESECRKFAPRCNWKPNPDSTSIQIPFLRRFFENSWCQLDLVFVEHLINELENYGTYNLDAKKPSILFPRKNWTSNQDNIKIQRDRLPEIEELVVNAILIDIATTNKLKIDWISDIAKEEKHAVRQSRVDVGTKLALIYLFAKLQVNSPKSPVNALFDSFNLPIPFYDKLQTVRKLTDPGVFSYLKKNLMGPLQWALFGVIFLGLIAANEHQAPSAHQTSELAEWANIAPVQTATEIHTIAEHLIQNQGILENTLKTELQEFDVQLAPIESYLGKHGAYTGRGIGVGVIDQDFKFGEDKIFSEIKRIEEESFFKGHGSHVAAVILQDAPLVELIALAVTPNTDTYRDHIRAFRKAARDPNMKIVNLSWGGTAWTGNWDLEWAIREFIHAGKILVHAAGNSDHYQGYTGMDRFPPEIEAGIIDVGGLLDGESEVSQTYEQVFSFPPAGHAGANFIWADGWQVPALGEKHTGSSFAAPLVAAAAALYWEKHPEATNIEVVRALMRLPKKEVQVLSLRSDAHLIETVSGYPVLDFEHLLRE